MTGRVGVDAMGCVDTALCKIAVRRWLCIVTVKQGAGPGEQTKDDHCPIDISQGLTFIMGIQDLCDQFDKLFPPKFTSDELAQVLPVRPRLFALPRRFVRPHRFKQLSLQM